MAAPVAFQQQAVGGVEAAHADFVTEIVRHQQHIQVAVGVEVVGDHAVDGGHLRQGGQRAQVKLAVALVFDVGRF